MSLKVLQAIKKNNNNYTSESIEAAQKKNFINAARKKNTVNKFKVIFCQLRRATETKLNDLIRIKVYSSFTWYVNILQTSSKKKITSALTENITS
jgi:Cu/Ag efflux pump CusA